MKLINIQEVEKFRKAVHQCEGNVYLKSPEGDVFNLKSSLSEYIALGRLLGEAALACLTHHVVLALGQLLSEQGDNLELFADRREDEALLLNFIAELNKENKALGQEN